MYLHTADLYNQSITFVFQALLAHGANIEAERGTGATSLGIASANGHLDVVEVGYSLQIRNRWHFISMDLFGCVLNRSAD